MRIVCYCGNRCSIPVCRIRCMWKGKRQLKLLSVFRDTLWCHIHSRNGLNFLHLRPPPLSCTIHNSISLLLKAVASQCCKDVRVFLSMIGANYICCLAHNTFLGIKITFFLWLLAMCIAKQQLLFVVNTTSQLTARRHKSHSLNFQ